VYSNPPIKMLIPIERLRFCHVLERLPYLLPPHKQSQATIIPPSIPQTTESRRHAKHGDGDSRPRRRPFHHGGGIQSTKSPALSPKNPSSRTFAFSYNVCSSPQPNTLHSKSSKYEGDALRLEMEEAVLGVQPARRDGYGRVGRDERERRRLIAKPLPRPERPQDRLVRPPSQLVLAELPLDDPVPLDDHAALPRLPRPRLLPALIARVHCRPVQLREELPARRP
jgi:hypothetical protein